ncbi:MAG: hypothetical protein ACLUR5_18205 [Eubacterium ventriosum]
MEEILLLTVTKSSTSTNGVDFETVKKVTGDSVKDACENKNCVDTQDMTGVTGAVRYIRFYYPEAYTWGVQG